MQSISDTVDEVIKAIELNHTRLDVVELLNRLIEQCRAVGGPVQIESDALEFIVGMLRDEIA